MKIIVPKSKLAAVRRECRKRFPKEYMVGVVGSRTATEIVIEDFVAIPHTANEDTCNYSHDTIKKLKIQALKDNREYLGSLHSHCTGEKIYTCEHLSHVDIADAHEIGEVISGIVFVYMSGKRSEIHWYQPTPPPEVEYV